MSSTKTESVQSFSDFVRSAIPQASSTSSTTSITITSVTPGVSLTYSTLPGNLPNTYVNQAAIWQAGGLAIPYTQPALGVTAVPGNSPQGSLEMGTNISTDSYVVAYSVGPALTASGAQTWGNACALAFIPAVGGGGYQYFTPSVTAAVQPTSLMATFTLPTGNTPANNGAWIGVWSGTPNFYITPPNYFQPITSNNPGIGVPFNGLKIGRGLTYTVVLFMSGYSTNSASLNLHTAAASYTFTVAS